MERMTHTSGFSSAIRECTIPREMNFIAPIAVDDMIRIGREHDGGYVVPRLAAKQADFLASFGLSEDWSFDEHFRDLNPSAQIHAYDHSISRKLFARRLQNTLARVCIGKSSIRQLRDRARILRSYDEFFQGQVKHFEERVFNRIDAPFDVTLNEVFQRTASEKSFLKIDIEGCEYRITDDLLRLSDRIIAMVVEYHDTDPLRQLFSASVRKLQDRFEIVHLHANNYRGVAIDGLPEILELTFVNKSALLSGGSKRTTLPLPLVDSPNNPNIPDYSLRFII